MALWTDPKVAIPGDVVVRLATVTAEMTQRMAELAVSSGLALLSIGTGRLLFDAACRDLRDDENESAVPHDLAA